MNSGTILYEVQVSDQFDIVYYKLYTYPGPGPGPTYGVAASNVGTDVATAYN